MNTSVTAQMPPLPHSLGSMPAVFWVFFVIILVVAVVVGIFFILSALKTVRAVPKAQHSVPMWLLWFTFLPFLGVLSGMPQPGVLGGFGTVLTLLLSLVAYAILWTILPFAIPNTLSRFFSENQLVKKAAHTLKVLAILWLSIAVLKHLLAFIFDTVKPGLGFFLSQLLSIAGMVFWIIYWVKLVSIRRHFPKD